MTQIELTKLRYPIGNFRFPKSFESFYLEGYIEEITDLPQRLRAATETLTAEQLETPFRENAWTVRQLVHHLADSHINLYTRIRLALTEENPTIKTYEEQGWANLKDAAEAPIEISLNLLESIHARSEILLKALTEQDLARTFVHPEVPRPMPLYGAIALFAWHGDHHLAHITSLKERKGW
ncbi:MAG: YfiT family bacillithiol transferase [Flammeovirgaceae bacterium]